MRCVLVSVLLVFIVSMGSGGNAASDATSAVRDACRVTRYRDICARTLSPYSRYAKQSPRRWAEASVLVTLGETKSVLNFLKTLKDQVHFRRKQKVAIADCIVVFSDALGSVSDSLKELKNLQARTFEFQIENVETWMSAVLTDDDTCLDGFAGKKGKRVNMIRNKVVRVSRITSNALALVTKLASGHPRNLAVRN